MLPVSKKSNGKPSSYAAGLKKKVKVKGSPLVSRGGAPTHGNTCANVTDHAADPVQSRSSCSCFAFPPPAPSPFRFTRRPPPPSSHSSPFRPVQTPSTPVGTRERGENAAHCVLPVDVCPASGYRIPLHRSYVTPAISLGQVKSGPFSLPVGRALPDSSGVLRCSSWLFFSLRRWWQPNNLAHSRSGPKLGIFFLPFPTGQLALRCWRLGLADVTIQFSPVSDKSHSLRATGICAGLRVSSNSGHPENYLCSIPEASYSSHQLQRRLFPRLVIHQLIRIRNVFPAVFLGFFCWRLFHKCTLLVPIFRCLLFSLSCSNLFIQIRGQSQPVASRQISIFQPCFAVIFKEWRRMFLSSLV